MSMNLQSLIKTLPIDLCYIFWLFLTFYLVFFTTSCKQQHLNTVRIDKKVSIHPAPPSKIKGSFSSHHSLSFTFKGKTVQMHSQIEKTANELTIVGFNSSLVNIFQINQIDHELKFKQYIKTPIKPKYLLGLYYLIFSDSETLKSLLHKNNSCIESKIGEGVTRSIFSKTEERIKITYLPFKNGTKINLRYNDIPIEISIIVDYVNPL